MVEQLLWESAKHGLIIQVSLTKNNHGILIAYIGNADFTFSPPRHGNSFRYNVQE
jgi:hypothetical protein